MEAIEAGASRAPNPSEALVKGKGSSAQLEAIEDDFDSAISRADPVINVNYREADWPNPDELGKLELLHPGFTKEVVTALRDEREHRHKKEMRQLDLDGKALDQHYTTSRNTQALTGLALVLAGFAIYMGVELAVVVLTIIAVAILASALTGRKVSDDLKVLAEALRGNRNHDTPTDPGSTRALGEGKVEE